MVDYPAPEDMRQAVMAGSAALEAGDLKGALARFREVIEAFPDRPEGHNNLGGLYAALGEYAEAEACFNHVLDLIPENANVLHNRGVIRIHLEKFDAAHDDFQRAVAALPEDAEAHNNLGVALFMRGAFDDARAHLRRAMDLQPGYENALLNLCDVEEAAGSPRTGVELCAQHLQQWPEAVDVRRRHFRLLTSGCCEALEQAGQVAQEILAADNTDTETRRRWGRILEARELVAAQGTA